MLSWFWGDIVGQEIPGFHDPYMYCIIHFSKSCKDGYAILARSGRLQGLLY